MNNKTLELITKILGVLFLLFGLMVSFTALTILFGTGTASIAETMAAKIGKNVGDFPYMYALMGVLFTGLLGVAYLVGAYGLLKKKDWAYKAVAGIGLLSILSAGYTFMIGAPFNAFELLWGCAYLFIAYRMNIAQK